jgi:ATP-dependent Zn protease
VNPEYLSEEIKTRLNQDVDKILKAAMAEVDALLRKEKDLFERFAHELMTKQELDYDEIEAIFAEFGKVNPRRSHLTEAPEPPKV